MSNWTTHHHLGGPIRVNEASSTTVRLLIKTSEVEKKKIPCLAPQPRTVVRLLVQFPYSALLYLYTTPHLARIISSERSRVALVRVHCPQLRHGTGQRVTTRPMPVVSEMSVLALADLDVDLVLSHASASSAKGYPRQPNAMPVSGAFKGLHECKTRCELGFGGWGRAGLKYIRTSYRLRFNRPIPLY